jgi:hypothetical protein
VQGDHVGEVPLMLLGLGYNQFSQRVGGMNFDPPALQDLQCAEQDGLGAHAGPYHRPNVLDDLVLGVIVKGSKAQVLQNELTVTTLDRLVVRFERDEPGQVAELAGHVVDVGLVKLAGKKALGSPKVPKHHHKSHLIDR